MRSNFAEVAQAYPDLVDARLFSEESGWRELVSTFSGEATSTMAHARRARYRHVFRSFVRVPDAAGGPACLEALYSRNQETRLLPCTQSTTGRIGVLASGRVLLIETLVAVSSDAELVPVPLVIGVEARNIGPLPAEVVTARGLGGLPVVVLHGLRAMFAAGERRRGGLELMGQEELVPHTFAAFKRYPGQPLTRLNRTCQMCHSRDGQTMGTDNFRAAPAVTRVLHPSNTVESERVLRAKQASAAYQALKQLF